MAYDDTPDIRVGDGLRCGWGSVRVVTRVANQTVQYWHPDPIIGIQVRPIEMIRGYLRDGVFVKVWACPERIKLPVGV